MSDEWVLSANWLDPRRKPGDIMVSRTVESTRVRGGPKRTRHEQEIVHPPTHPPLPTEPACMMWIPKTYF